jgi:hypothetical protein
MLDVRSEMWVIALIQRRAGLGVALSFPRLARLAGIRHTNLH